METLEKKKIDAKYFPVDAEKKPKIVSRIFLFPYRLVKGLIILLKDSFWYISVFSISLIIYTIIKLIINFLKWRILPQNFTDKLNTKVAASYIKIAKILGLEKEGSIGRLELIELSLRSLKKKKSRTLITVGGMAIGIAAIVFLVSLGYGLQDLVISRIAKLNEMMQADVTTQAGSKVRINDETLSNINSISEINSAMPMISVVGKVSYQNSVSDVAVYGVTSQYLNQSAVQPIKGEIFDSNELVSILPNENTEQVLGESSIKENDQKIIGFKVDSEAWLRVRETPSPASKLIGYTKKVENKYTGEEVLGEKYTADDEQSQTQDENGEIKGKWIKSEFLLWDKKKCEDCDKPQYKPIKNEDGSQMKAGGYVAQIGVEIIDDTNSNPIVLGEEDVAPSTTVAADTSVDWIDLPSETQSEINSEEKVSLGASAKKEAVVNLAMLDILGIPQAEAIGKKFETSFIVTNDLLGDANKKLVSTPEEYTIVGVVNQGKNSLFYVPFIDLRSLGIVNYSQIKLIAKSKEVLKMARDKVESIGFATTSVADTVSQVNGLFATARNLLAIIGTIALAVAALGMFNTLTVSLLERTREVGLMKSLGMKSTEVSDLFLTESMIMGFFGGVLGLLLGYAGGKLVGFLLTIFAFGKSGGFLDVSQIPLIMVINVLILAMLVGVFTGFYPARRAKKISALNALRYE
jgi:ABC-type antimicrobial peptide transport system permease subunit